MNKNKYLHKIITFDCTDIGIFAGHKISGKVIEEHENHVVVERRNQTFDVDKDDIIESKTQAESVYGKSDCCGAYSSEHCDC